MRGYRDLIAWQKAMELATNIYRASRAFPRDELHGLTSQLRRSAVRGYWVTSLKGRGEYRGPRLGE